MYTRYALIMVYIRGILSKTKFRPNLERLFGFTISPRLKRYIHVVVAVISVGARQNCKIVATHHRPLTHAKAVDEISAAETVESLRRVSLWTIMVRMRVNRAHLCLQLGIGVMATFPSPPPSPRMPSVGFWGSSTQTLLATAAGQDSSGQADGVASAASFSEPVGIVLHHSLGLLLIADRALGLIRSLDVSSSAVSTIAGSTTNGISDGVGTNARFREPWGTALSSDQSTLYITDVQAQQVRALNLETAAVTTLAGSGLKGSTDGAAFDARFRDPMGIAVCADGITGRVYVADSGNHLIRMLTVTSGSISVSTLAGSSRGFTDGNSAAAAFNGLSGLACTADGGRLYVADTGNHAIRELDLISGRVRTVAGSGSSGVIDGATAQFHSPQGLAITPDGALLYVADTGNNLLRAVVTETGQTSAIAGSGDQGTADASPALSGRLHSPNGLALTSDAAVLYISTGVESGSGNYIRVLRSELPPPSPPLPSPPPPRLPPSMSRVSL